MTQGNLDIDKNIDEKAIKENENIKEETQEEVVSDPNKLYNILGVMFETTKKTIR